MKRLNGKKSPYPSTGEASATTSFISTSITGEEGLAVQGLRKTNHGVIFQLKLLVLFLIRGIEAGWMFKLGTEMEEIGGKFDDLIFKYQVDHNSGTAAGSRDRCRYLQAKHKQNESFQITASQLLNNKEGDFSLLKYFRSFCDIMSRGDDIEDCIICTNAAFNKENLKRNGIELLLLSLKSKDKILDFGECSDHIRCKINVQSNHNVYAMLKEVEFEDPLTKTRRKVSGEEIELFFEKLIFVTNTPNEVDLGQILTDQVGKYYKVKEADFQSDFVLRNMLDWFKKKESKFITSNEGIDILRQGKEKLKSIRMTAVSIHYQRQLKQALQFNRDAIHEMGNNLKAFFISSKKIEHIRTRLPKRIAVKVIGAIKDLRKNIGQHLISATATSLAYFERKDSYLMTSLSEIKKEREKFKSLFLKADHSHSFLVVVCEDDSVTAKTILYFEKLVKNSNKKIMIISQAQRDAVEDTSNDDLKFADLSADFKKTLLSKEILFQETSRTVGNLISDQTIDELTECGSPTEKVIDSDVIEELINKERLQIASFSSSRFEKSLYIKRQLTSAFPLDNSFWTEVATGLGYSTELLESKCRVNSKGEIQWFVTGEEKKKIWQKINIVLEKSKSLSHLPSKTVDEDELLKPKNHKKSSSKKEAHVVIVSGVAGSGKSSILSHYYHVIKEMKPDHWVIVLSLTDHSEAFLKLKSNVVNKWSVANFLLDLSVVDNSPFACSLLRHRLNTGDRMVVMLDGFDESHHTDTVIEIIKVLKEMKLNGLLVTTRSHMTSQIQFELSQLTYSLKNFSKQDQVKYLASTWKRYYNNDGIVEKDLWCIAESLVDRVSESLKDEEKAFIGIPLQCRILAECFQSELPKLFQQDDSNSFAFTSFIKKTERLNFSLASLYRLLMERKHEIYRQEKKAQTGISDLASSHAKQDIGNLEPFLRKLAIKTIVSCDEHVDVLMGKKKSMKPKDVLAKKNQKMVRHCARFGLLDRNAEGEVRFLHRTYAEYLMAEYLYTGFLLDDEKRNHLLDYESARKLIIGKILVNNHFDGVQIFLDSMLKDLVDDSQEWRNGIVQHQLPDGLHELAKVFFNRVVYQKMNENSLELSVANKREKIFKFLCDCLDATFDKAQVLSAIRFSFTHPYSFNNFCHLNSQVFQRYMDYFDDVPITAHGVISATSKEKNHVRTVMKGLLNSEFMRGLNYSYWDGEEPQKMLYRLIQFMDKHRQVFNQIFLIKNEYITSTVRAVGTILAILIFNKNYDSHLKLFVNLLSQSDLYSDDFAFSNFIKNVFISVKRKHRIIGLNDRLQKVLVILNELHVGRPHLSNTLNQICAQIVRIEPRTFKAYYEPCQLLEEKHVDELSTDFHLLLERDSFRFSCFHREDTYGIMPTAVDWIPDQTVTGNVDYYGCITPFYVAATWGRDKICCNLLTFLKRHLPVATFKKGFVDIEGFVHRSLSDAILSENTETCKVILNAVKQTLGQGDLIDLLKSTVQERLYSINLQHYQHRTWDNDWTDKTIFFLGCQCKMYKTIADIVLDIDNATGKIDLYEDMNNLIFDNITALKSVDGTTLQGMVSLKGSEYWTKRLLDLHLFVGVGFPSLVDNCLNFFNQGQLLKFVTTLTTKSYWGRLRAAACVGNYVGTGDLRILKFLKFISDKLDESILLELLLYDEGNSRCITSYILSQELARIFSKMLSKEGQEKVRQHWLTNVPLMIEEQFLCPTSENCWQIEKSENWLMMIRIYLDYANDEQLKKFISFITHVRESYGRFATVTLRSIWSYVFLLDDVTESNEILKRVLEKPSTFGHEAVKTLLYHEFENIPVILRAALKENFNGRLVELPNHIQEEIRNYVTEHTSQLMEECFRDPILNSTNVARHNDLKKFVFLLNYCNYNQCKEVITKMTSLPDETDSSCSQKRSIWGNLFDSGCHVSDVSIQTMRKFLKCVSEKLDPNEVTRLVLHDDIILSKALKYQENLIEAMLSFLEPKNRKMIQSKIDEFCCDRSTRENSPGVKVKTFEYICLKNL